MINEEQNIFKHTKVLFLPSSPRGGSIFPVSVMGSCGRRPLKTQSEILPGFICRGRHHSFYCLVRISKLSLKDNVAHHKYHGHMTWTKFGDHTKFGHQLAPLALVAYLAIRWRHLPHWISLLLALSVDIELVSSFISHIS